MFAFFPPNLPMFANGNEKLAFIAEYDLMPIFDTIVNVIFTLLYSFIPLFGINKWLFVEIIRFLTQLMKSSVHHCLGKFYTSIQCVAYVAKDSCESSFCNNSAYYLIFTGTSYSWATCSFLVTSHDFILLLLLNDPTD